MPWTESHLKRILSNPYYCLPSIDERLIDEHEPLVTEEEFITAGARFIRDYGPEEYLRELLENLKGNFVVSDDIDGAGVAFGLSEAVGELR